MRIRTVKPEFFSHEGLYDAEVESKLPLRVAFAGLWCAADREGRFKWRPRYLQTVILPYDKCDMARVLDALATRGFIVKYASDGDEFGVIPSFTRHQVVNNRESASVLPEPSQDQLLDACLTRDDACLTPLSPAQAEGKGREGNVSSTRASREPRQTETELPEGFTPAPSHIEFASRSGLDIELEFAKFVNYWKSKGGKEARKKDWHRTLTNWLLNSAERKGTANKLAIAAIAGGVR